MRNSLDAISLTNSLPGPIATNSATFVGYRVARGQPGAAAAILGAALPSVIVILLIAMVFNNIVEYPVVQYIFDGVRPCGGGPDPVLGDRWKVRQGDGIVQLGGGAGRLCPRWRYSACNPIIVVICAALRPFCAQSRAEGG